MLLAALRKWSPGGVLVALRDLKPATPRDLGAAESRYAQLSEFTRGLATNVQAWQGEAAGGPVVLMLFDAPDPEVPLRELQLVAYQAKPNGSIIWLACRYMLSHPLSNSTVSIWPSIPHPGSVPDILAFGRPLGLVAGDGTASGTGGPCRRPTRWPTSREPAFAVWRAPYRWAPACSCCLPPVGDSWSLRAQGGPPPGRPLASWLCGPGSRCWPRRSGFRWLVSCGPSGCALEHGGSGSPSPRSCVVRGCSLWRSLPASRRRSHAAQAI